MIKIAHEAPIDLFDEVQRLTDYDYALVHLLEENSRYRDTFEHAVKKGRETYLVSWLEDYVNKQLFKKLSKRLGAIGEKNGETFIPGTYIDFLNDPKTFDIVTKALPIKSIKKSYNKLFPTERIGRELTAEGNPIFRIKKIMNFVKSDLESSVMGGVEEIDASWALRDGGYNFVWPTMDALYCMAMEDVYPTVIAIKAKASKEFISPRQFLMNRKNEGAKEYLGELSI